MKKRYIIYFLCALLFSFLLAVFTVLFSSGNPELIERIAILQTLKDTADHLISFLDISFLPYVIQSLLSVLLIWLMILGLILLFVLVFKFSGLLVEYAVYGIYRLTGGQYSLQRFRKPEFKVKHWHIIK